MRTGIVGALDEEIKLLLDNLEDKREETALRHTFYQGTLAGRPVVLTTSGIGKVRAAARTQFLIDHFPIQRFIFVGVAGAINPALKVGDVIVSRRALQHDFDISSFTDKKGNHWYEADPLLADLALKAGGNIGLKDKMYLGSVLSGDQGVAQLSKKKWLWETFAGDCVEMEGAAAALVCWMNQVPFVLIRTISDLAEEKSAPEFSEGFKQAVDRSASIVLEMLKALPPDC